MSILRGHIMAILYQVLLYLKQHVLTHVCWLVVVAVGIVFFQGLSAQPAPVYSALVAEHFITTVNFLKINRQALFLAICKVILERHPSIECYLTPSWKLLSPHGIKWRTIPRRAFGIWDTVCCVRRDRPLSSGRPLQPILWQEWLVELNISTAKRHTNASNVLPVAFHIYLVYLGTVRFHGKSFCKLCRTHNGTSNKIPCQSLYLSSQACRSVGEGSRRCHSCHRERTVAADAHSESRAAHLANSWPV